MQEQGKVTLSAIEAELETPGLLPAGIERLKALARALHDQVGDITELVGPVLGVATPAAGGGSLPRGIVEYIQFLYRDWSWETDGNGENQQALSAVQKVLGPGGLGRTLVVGQS